MANYDIIGSIAIIKFDKKTSKKEKLKQAKRLLEFQRIKTILEKTDKVSGRLRTIKTKFIAGVDTKETIYKENNCVFRLNVETCYFSPRLSEERKEIANFIKKKDKVLVLFSGVNPFGITIAKLKGAKVVAVELGRECCKYALENALRNKVDNLIETIQGDVKKIIPKLAKKKRKFDVIVMPRPNLKESFLREALAVSKKGTMIFYYCFGQKEELNKSLEEIYKTAKKKRKKIKILNVKRAGEIAPYTHRWRISFKIL